MLEKFERYPLTFGSTPIEKLDRLSGHLGNKVNIYAKREDCNSGLAGGGNKIRKLEYISKCTCMIYINVIVMTTFCTTRIVALLKQKLAPTLPNTVEGVSNDPQWHSHVEHANDNDKQTMYINKSSQPLGFKSLRVNI